MNIRTADNLSQLEEFVRAVRKKAKFKVFNTQEKIKFLGMTFGEKEKASRGFVNYHDQIIFNDEIIDVKAPSVVGRFILNQRPKLEEEFNDSYLVKETIKDKVKREGNYLEQINNSDLKKFEVKTFESRQELLQQFKKPLQDVLLTKYEKDLMPSNKFFKKSDTNFLKEYLVVLSKKLRFFHDSGFILGDARINNTGSTGKDIFIYDFEFKTNPKMSFEEKRIKDLLGFTLNAVGKKKFSQYDAIETIFNSYNAKDFSKQIIHETSKQKKFDLEKQKKYSKPIHNLSFGAHSVTHLTLSSLANQYI